MGVLFKRRRFPADVIRYAVWLYFRFTLNLRDVEEMLAERGIEVSYETIRCWTKKFGPQLARQSKTLRPVPSPRWHLDEMVCTVAFEARSQATYFWNLAGLGLLWPGPADLTVLTSMCLIDNRRRPAGRSLL